NRDGRVTQAQRAEAPGLEDAGAQAGTVPERAASGAPTSTTPTAHAPASAARRDGVRESLLSRARAVFRIDEGPTLAELTTGTPAAADAGGGTPARPAPAGVPAPARSEEHTSELQSREN